MWRVVVVAAMACTRPPAEHAASVSSQPLQPGASAPIVRGAVTEDGTAAVTSDDFGGIRLWPRLDGTREPLVVFGPSPRALALAHDASEGFGVAIVDDAQTLTITTIDAHNRASSRQVDTVAGVTATGAELVAWLADATIETFDLHGTRTARVVVPGHLVRVVARAGRVLAIVASQRGTIGYWIEHGAIGEATHVLPLDAESIALSPDGAHVAGIHDQAAASVELATGALQPLVHAARESVGHDDDDDDGDDDAAELDDDDVRRCVPVGYIGRDVVACVGTRGVFWLDTHGVVGQRALLHTRHRQRVFSSVIGTADAIVVAGRSNALELLVPNLPPSYLGYQIAAPHRLRPSPHGLVLGAANHGWSVLDGRLEIASRLTDESAETVIDALPLDGYVATLTLDREHGAGVQLAAGSDVLRTVASAAITYEASTGLAAVSLGDDLAFVHVASRQIETLTAKFPIPQVWLLDPNLAHGKVALIENNDDIFTLRADELSSSLVKRVPDRHLADVIAADRSGRLYQRAHGKFVGLVVDGHPFADTTDFMVASPDSTGALVAVGGTSWLALYDVHGTRRWRTVLPMPGPVWQGDQLYVSTRGGLVRVDVATGAIEHAHCGWVFGKLAEPPPPAADVESLCSR
jgi:hypothetical protein